MDLILGRFADGEIATLSEDELSQLERLLEIPEPDLYAALTSDKLCPDESAGPVFERIKTVRAVGQA